MDSFSRTASADSAQGDAAPAHGTPCFADITTMGVGGLIHVFETPDTQEALIDTVRSADESGLPLCVVGGGSNLLASDADFDGVVVRDARSEIVVDGGVADSAGTWEPVGPDGAGTARVTATAGVMWDDFVQWCTESGFAQVQGLSGVPGTVGASVVQNIGAYGQEVAHVVDSVEVWDRQDCKVMHLSAGQMRFGYRTSLLKASMYRSPGKPKDRFFPTPRFVVLSVTFSLPCSAMTQVLSGQLAAALGVDVGASMPNAAVRAAVLAVRARKGMLEDPYRYRNPWMSDCRSVKAVGLAIREVEGATQSELANRHSCGSFFVNPILTADQAAALPEDAPRYHVPSNPDVSRLADGDSAGIKTSAAWLIDHAGFHKGFALGSDCDGVHAHASLSTAHTLALTNRGGASAMDVVALARAVRRGVHQAYGVELIAEPVVVGMDID